MRRLHRPTLPRKPRVWLIVLTREVITAPDPKVKAADLWRAKAKHRYRMQVHALLRSMASGLARCMYCEDSAAQAIEHFWPKSDYPERAFCWENLLLTCDACNRNKGKTFPLDEGKRPLLIDPTAEDPALHLVLSPRTGDFLARDGSRKASETIRVIKLNRADLRKGRYNAWHALPAFVAEYARARAAKKEEHASHVERIIREHPYSAVLHFLVRVLDLPDPGRYLPDGIDVEALGSVLPDLRRWVEAIEGPPP